MQCQVIYWDDHTCPPLVMKREGRGKKTSAPKRETAALPESLPMKPPAPIKFTVNSMEKEDAKV
jgi:hypothetical protein